MAIQTPNILIIDDREIAVHSIRNALQAEGYRNIRSAHDAQQALAMHAENPAEVVLAD
jgi:PleD family two-component response regulator